MTYECTQCDWVGSIEDTDCDVKRSNDPMEEPYRIDTCPGCGGEIKEQDNDN